MGKYRLYDENVCQLGEGILWHPERNQAFWFDITSKQMRSRIGTEALVWQFDEQISAAGWIDSSAMLVASETALNQVHLDSEKSRIIVPLEADNPRTRSNDGRADPWGGYWISTMGKLAEEGMGSIYRFYRGKLTKIYTGLTIPNSICFSMHKRFIFFSDTPSSLIMRQGLDSQGWPQGKAEVFIDMSSKRLQPDGAIIDAYDHLWVAQWGAGQISRYKEDGTLDRVLNLPVRQPSCPAFGGSDLSTLFFTSASEGLLIPSQHDGKVWCLDTDLKGVCEPCVKLIH